ncbi:MAG: glycoside hydrolase family 71/99-like protein [Thermoguttaceae bacterium]
MKRFSLIFSVIFVFVLCMTIRAAEPVSTTLTGSIMCGYQGWFTAEGDGSQSGFIHYSGSKGKFEPGNCSIDIWPDMSEMDDDEKYVTSFKNSDGSPAHVFSSQNPKTVNRHFLWMAENDIQGVYLQRFIGEVSGEPRRSRRQQVLENVRKGAENHSRTYCIMYDLSGGNGDMIPRGVIEDWKRLVSENRVTEDRTYQRHNGKPVIAIWGIGFNDNRKYTLQQCLELITFLKDDPEFGGNTVMIGVPTYWRELQRDCMPDPLLHEIAKKADIISPWAVGRFGTPEQAKNYAEKTAAADLKWCRENGKEFLPVVFPGFSWHNLMKIQEKEGKLDAIPRLKGEFLRAQLDSHIENGSTMIYQAMFDEIDEGTAVFKCTNNPPVGSSPFLTYENLPSDFYLKLLKEYALKLKKKFK